MGIFSLFYLVALVGLEPTLIAELDFESSASTNSATGPKAQAVIMQPVLLQLFLPGEHCDLPYVQASLQGPQVCRPFFQWLS